MKIFQKVIKSFFPRTVAIKYWSGEGMGHVVSIHIKDVVIYLSNNIYMN